MSAGDTQTQRPLTIAARKHLLLVACTIDRLDLAAALHRPPAPVPWLNAVTALPWFPTAASIATRMLPRKLRFLLTIWRTWQKAQGGS